jgi:carboxyl-terminal processing protease
MLIKYVFFNFSKHYMAVHHSVDKNFNVDDAVMQEFRKFLDDQKIAFTEADLKDNDEWIRGNIKAELFVNQFGAQEGLRVHAETDPVVMKGLDLLPQAKQLADNAKKIIAAKSAPQPQKIAATSQNQ